MDTALFLPVAFFGVRFGFTLIIASIVFAFFPFSRAFRRTAPLTLLAATLIGATSAVLFLCSGSHEEIPIVFVRSMPWLIFNLNTLSALFILLINSVALLSSWYSLRYVDLITKNLRESQIMHAQTGVFVLGMLGAVLASTPLGFLFFWELMSFASFFLVMSDKKEASQNAALFYLAMTQLGALFITAGFAVAMDGHMVAPFYAVLSPHDPKLLVAFLFLFIGFGSKAGLLPLHAWLPKAHPQAPSHISALMSGAMLKVALYGFILTVIKVLPPLPAAYGAMVATIGLLTAVFAVLHAAAEKEMKTLLAWSSVENMGLLFAMVGTALFASAAGPSWLVPVAIASTIFLAFNHAFFKGGLFLAAGVLAHEMHVHNLEEMGGLAKRMPKFSKWVFLLAIAAAALPPFGAFFAEWTFLRGLLASMSGSGVSLPAGIFYLFVFVTVGFVGGIAVFAMTKFFGIAFLGQPRTKAASHASEPSAVFFRGPIMLALLAVFGLGLFATQGIDFLQMQSITWGLGDTFALFATDGFASTMTFLLLIGFGIALLNALLVPGGKRERVYHTWDCGQPITPRMEYTATAFSAPLRFFFRFILRTKKQVTSEAILETNPYVRRRSLTLVAEPFFDQFFYGPIKDLLAWEVRKVKRLHGGSLQAYLVFMFITLFLTLIIAL